MRAAPLIACALLAAVLAGCASNTEERASQVPTRTDAAPASGAPNPAQGGEGNAAAEGSSTADPALVFSVDDPCVAPCLREGLPYGSAVSELNPGAGEQLLKLDLFRSARTPVREAPVVVLLHGGGFVSGDRRQMRRMAEALADGGFLVASISYRLADPGRNRGAGLVKDAELETASGEVEADAERAIAYLRANHEELGITDDPGRYAVGGYSAGAIASLRVAVRAGDASTASGRRVRIGGAFAISGSECSGPFVGRLGCEAAYDKADSPLLIFHGDQDEVVALAGARATCADAITDGGGCTAYFYAGQGHLWPTGTILGGSERLTAKSPAVTPTIAAWLRKNLAS